MVNAKYALVRKFVWVADLRKYETVGTSYNPIGLFQWYADAMAAMNGIMEAATDGACFAIIDIDTGQISWEKKVSRPVENEPEPYDGVPADTGSI